MFRTDPSDMPNALPISLVEFLRLFEFRLILPLMLRTLAFVLAVLGRPLPGLRSFIPVSLNREIIS